MDVAIWTLVAGLLGLSGAALAVCIQSTQSLGNRMDAGFGRLVSRLDVQSDRIDALVKEMGNLTGRVGALESHQAGSR